MEYIRETKQWLERFVIALNLCPFASVPFRKDRIRYVVEDSDDPDQLVKTFLGELDYLQRTEPALTETTLIIHPHCLPDFEAYNDFLSVVDELLEATGLVGVVQVASFHPDYQFAGAPTNDPANYTNRSPFPMLHLLREDSVKEAVDHFPETEQIPEVNIERLRAMTIDEIKNYWKKPI